MKRINPVLLAALSTFVVFTNCKKDEKDPEPEPVVETPASYTVPVTYDFGANMSLTSSNQRVAMFRELITYVRSTHTATANVTLSEQKMINMFSNTGNPFADAGNLGLNASGISLKEKTNNIYGAAQELEAIFKEAATVSQTTVSGTNGTAGKVLGPVPTTTGAVQAAYLMSSKGFEYKELVEKGGMGALMYSEAMTLLKNIGSYDNTTVIAGKGTAMEHAWDEAFGYFSVPVSFPTTTTGVAYWGSYCNSVNGVLGTNATIMNAWLKGRAAISNKDVAGRDAARDIVVATWEKVGAARFITYMKQAKTNFANDGARNHSLSEGVGFIRAFKYNPAKTISDGDINLLMGYIGSNLYEVTETNIQLSIDKMAAVFNLDATKL
ncbi:hypothetical protein CNR22_20280 [Sphingobacteriaceae bacterium]|nr:hypothetical protein CNR22_20280 [Sphingobacteriaceae bacterium]